MPEANAKLPGPEREVLALLAEGGFGYAAIGELLGVEPRTVGEIAARARLRLAQDGVPSLAEPCSRELSHLAARIDGEALPPSDREHLRRCPVCRANLDVMRRADARYRAPAPAPMPDALRRKTRALISDEGDGTPGR